MADEKLRFEADVTDFVKAADKAKAALDGIGKKAESVSREASAAMDKTTAAINRTAAAGAGAAGAIGGGGGGGGIVAIGGGGRGRGRVGPTIANARRAGAGKALGTLAGGALAGRVGGAMAGRGIGGALGSVGGPLGTIAGSVIGGGIASLMGGGRGPAEPTAEDESANRVEQLILRGFDRPMSTAIDKMSQDMETKFQIDSDAVASAIVDAQAGNAAQLKQLLQDIGVNPETIGTMNEAISVLAQASSGASDKAKADAEATDSGQVGKAWDRITNTETGKDVSGVVSGIAGTPGAIWGSIKRGAANVLNAGADMLGGEVGQTGKQAAVAPALKRDSPLTTSKRPTGDMRIVVSAPKSVPTVTKNNGGR